MKEQRTAPPSHEQVPDQAAWRTSHTYAQTIQDPLLDDDTQYLHVLPIGMRREIWGSDAKNPNAQDQDLQSINRNEDLINQMHVCIDSVCEGLSEVVFIHHKRERESSRIVSHIMIPFQQREMMMLARYVMLIRESISIVRGRQYDIERFFIIAKSIIIKGTRRSRTAARSESSTSPSTHRPPIESSSSSTLLASSMMVHIDDDLDAM